METDYMTSATELPPHLVYPRFLLRTELKQITKVIYTVLLDEATHAQANGWVDKRGRLYVALPASRIAQTIDRTPATVRNALNELEAAGLIERRLTSHTEPDYIYVMLPDGEGGK